MNIELKSEQLNAYNKIFEFLNQNIEQQFLYVYLCT